MDITEEQVPIWQAVFKLVEDKFTGGGWGYVSRHLVAQKAGTKIPDNKILTEMHTKYGEDHSAPYIEAFGQIIRTVWNKTDCERRDVEFREIPSEIFPVIHKHVRWAPLQGGAKVCLIRTSSYNTWEIAVDPWGALALFGPEGGIDDEHPDRPRFLNEIEATISQMQLDGTTKWGVMDSEDDDGRPVRVRKPFAQTTADLEDFIKNDTRFLMNLPVTFTNDPEVPASSYFPLHDLEKHMVGTCEAFLDFESQIHPRLIPAWRASFYAPFFDKNRSRQMVCLYDTGQTGKSNLFASIGSVVSGNFFAPLSKGALDNNFGMAKVYGCRLILFSDTGNKLITQMDKVKQLSGGDYVDVEFKGVNSKIRWRPNCRIWWNTNRRPEINIFVKNQTSRSLVFALTRTTDKRILRKFCATDENGEILYNSEGEPRIIGAPYDKWMAEQFYDYLHLCKASYEELCPTHQDIIVPQEMEDYIRESCVSAATDTLDLIRSTYIQLTEDPEKCVISNSDLRALIEYVAGTVKNPDLDYEQLSDYLLDRGLRRGSLRQGGTPVRGWRGIEFRDGWGMEQGAFTRKRAMVAVNTSFS